MLVVTGVTGEKQTFYNYFATKSLIITCDTCDTLEWIIVVTVRQSINQGPARKALNHLNVIIKYAAALGLNVDIGVVDKARQREEAEQDNQPNQKWR